MENMEDTENPCVSPRMAPEMCEPTEQEVQLAGITCFLRDRGYSEVSVGTKYNEMVAGTFTFQKNYLMLSVHV